mmetsp:Transcript_35276/g.80594  ORF Transcript_35276/g.80594 Transcript_35276/m.80594 type:complete len:891 (-) Transcript_35276:276-2948(-)|eukprot:CAMPEP_0114556572 /NCGR_PEP_ID=MMETSP0114-20121206/9361_1 /TAXON_ID=31324 /ORGANISM="Goniomonas sp, Strain m" /LENGTH=890 /DNA_ID=CAMNT_0001741787 /DNA_START=86 /DNA_END=2758 /DNA_ORIENTATION=-
MNNGDGDDDPNGDPRVDGEGDEDDDYEEEEDLDLVLEPDNPLVVRIRDVLTKQLTDIHGRITEDLRVKEEDLRRIKRKREDIGVDLYGVQQQLAKLQMLVEKTHDEYNLVVKNREEAEINHERVNNEINTKRIEVTEQQRRLAKFQQELDKLSATTHQVEQYNEQMKSEIAVARRVTYKAEESVAQLEKEKQTQDVYIDELTQRMKVLHDQLALYVAQLDSQKNETGSARETLAEAAQEMEKIRFEKKQLLNQWRSSLLAIARRDEELQATEVATREWKEKRTEVEGQISSYKQSIRAEEEKNEKLVGIVTKVRNEASYLERQVESIREQKSRLNEQYTMLKKSLDTTDAEFTRVGHEQKLVNEDIVKIDRATVEVAQESQEVEQTIFRNLSDQTTLEKDKSHVAKATEKMRQEIHRKENEMAQVQNELARIRVDSLNTIAHNDQLHNTLKEVETELKRKEQLIAKYELEIRRRTDELEKKMRDLDGLNRKYETIKQRFAEQVGAEMAEVGPLEATIRNLGREIDALKRECGELQRLWMTSQTDLVQLQNEAVNVSEKVSEMNSSQAVLNQKRLRLEGTVRQQESEIKELEAGIKVMHSDMSRLNDLIAKNAQMHAALEDANFTIQTGFQHKLLDLEEEAIRLESQIVAIKEDKDRMLVEVLEAERQVMLIDRKIELERETQSAYNQEDDTGELIAGMKKEIHRMTLRYQQLMHRQEELMVEMERNIFKRENIASKGKTAGRVKQTAGDIKRVVGELSGKVRDTENEIARYEKQLRQLEKEQEQVGQQLDEAGNACGSMQKTEDELQAQMFSFEKTKQGFLHDTLRHQRMVKRYQQVFDGKYQPPDPAAIQAGLERANDRRQTLRQIADTLREEDPRFEAAFRRITEIAP